jgi:hypothetical protein
MSRIKKLAVVSAALGLLAASSSSVLAQKKYDPGASDTEIKIGNIMPYSGPASAYGVIGKTEEAYFKKVNAEGGINGRKINFITYDDAYSPPKTVEQARKLVESDEVLFVFNPLGTPSNSAIQKYLNSKKVPQLFVATGATVTMASPIAGVRDTRSNYSDLMPAAAAQFLGVSVHANVRQTIGILILLPTDVLEGNIANLHHEHARFQVERFQPFVLDLVVALHLLDDQLRIALDRDLLEIVIDRPLQRGDQAVVFRDVVGGVAERAAQLREHVAEIVDDVHAVAGGAWVAPRAAVKERGDQGACGASGALGA